MAYVPNQGSVAAWIQSDNASVITVNQGSIATVIIGGSIAASFTPPANQSVSGVVGVSVIGVPTVQTGNNSVITLIQGSVAVSVTPVANQSISGTVGANLNSTNASVITISQGSIATVIVGGSIVASFTPPANQSVSGIVGVSVIGYPAVNVGGSVVAFQGIAPWANLNVGSTITISQGSIAAVIIGGSIAVALAANQSVSGTVGASVIGVVPVTQSGTWSQSIVGQGPAGALNNGWPIINGEANDSTGTFTNATQTTSVTNNNLDGYGNSLISINGTYGTASAIFEGSDDGGTTWYTVAAARDDLNVIETGYTSLTNISRSWQINNSGFDSIRVRSTAVASGTINVRISSSSAPNSSGATVGIGIALPTGTNVIGAVAASISGVVSVTLSGNPSISGTVNIAGNPSISGTVQAQQSGTWSASVMTNVITSIATAGQVMGSVAALQATNPWIVNFQNSSIIAINAGSVVAVSQGSIITVLQNPSIVGTYAEDAPAASGDKGFLVMGARNDTLASVTSNDGDYSSHVVGPAGELIAANAPFTKWVNGTTSVLNQFGASMITIAAQGSSIFTYITSGQVANMSPNSVLVTFSGATSSIVGYTIAPSGGGSNFVIPNAWKSNANGAITASVSGVSSVYISLQGFISKT